MAVTLPVVVEELLSEMAAAVRETARIPDEHLSSLKFIFGSSAIQALDLVDRQSITLISSPSGRHIYQVLGSSGKTYTCLASCHYCSCPAFTFSVLRKSESLLYWRLNPEVLTTELHPALFEIGSCKVAQNDHEFAIILP
ncbi:zinc finger SWIM domain-containing protein 7 isoform X2 [Urocitellus parryii]|uniref:zinc finger SWIM domain-containing protein 7 isoform X2 n=1 Tax=Urocitellus parryii TaxID=9999 RepID=UPI000E55F97F|nr:zinc finger SWIM domain-containing protein 7 isoform X2 [Urocitellus parryii]